jgi:hypothetical protein
MSNPFGDQPHSFVAAPNRNVPRLAPAKELRNPAFTTSEHAERFGRKLGMRGLPSQSLPANYAPAAAAKTQLTPPL